MIKMSTDSVSTDKRLDPAMEDTADLEDGEIESDEETETVKTVEQTRIQSSIRLKTSQNDTKLSNKKSFYKDKYRKSSKNNKEKKTKEIASTNSKENNAIEDDWASNVEKAIANAIRKESDASESKLGPNCNEKDKRRRKRKRKTSSKDSSKKAKTDRAMEGSTAEESIDEDELLGIRGGSPVNIVAADTGETENFAADCANAYESYTSGESHDSDSDLRNYDERRKHNRIRGSSRRNERKSYKRRATPGNRDCHPMQDPEGVCLFYLQGKCQRSEGCPYSHNAEPHRKMELCKFYLMDCCAKKEKCLYLHSDFPCKFYHTGLKCFQKDDCKFAHGKPLTNDFKNILLKHIETAPKEILGDFPRLSREGALNMVNAAQQKLLEQQKPLCAAQSPIPSLFDLTIPKPKGLEAVNNKASSKLSKSSSGVRKSRWCDSQTTIESPVKTSNNISPRNQSQNQDQTYLNIQNLNGLLTPNQINELTYLGITKLDELNQLTVKQLNELGITMIQINEIQLNALNLQKITSLNAANNQGISQDGKDLDLRIPSLLRNDATAVTTCNKDVDMRYDPLKDVDKKPVEGSSTLSLNKFNNENTECATSDVTHENVVHTNEEHKAPVIDYSQYLKDSRLNLDRDVKQNDADDRNTDNANDEKDNYEKSGLNKIDNNDVKTITESGDKTDPMLGVFRNMNSAQIDRLLDSVVDDDEALQIDENLYSSDEQEDESKLAPDCIKIDTHEEDNQKENTLDKSNTIANYLPEKSLTYSYGSITNFLLPGTSNISCEVKSPEPANETDAVYTPTGFDKCSEDVDLRLIGDLDMRFRNFGDTDLRQVRLDTDLRVARDTDLRDNRSNSDVDLRGTPALDLPFKPVTQYTPASEIDGSITSHPPIVYKVFVVDVPIPDYSNIIRSVPQSQAATDPRLRRILKLSGNTAAADDVSEVLTAPAAPVQMPDESVAKKARVDPRKRKESIADTLKSNAPLKPSVLDIQVVLQTSEWYKELSTNQKIMVNQQLAAVSSLLKQFNQDKSAQKIFDLSPIKSNPILCSILQNLGIYLTESGQFAYTKDAALDITQTGLMSTNDSTSIRGVGTNLIGPPLGASCINHMGLMPSMMNSGFENRFQADPRMGTGLLGMAPNMPFEGYNPNGQYNSDNYGNYMNFGFSNEPSCDDDSYHYRNSNNNHRGNRNQGGNGPNNMNNRNNNEHWANRPDRNNGPRRNVNERGRVSNHRPRDRGGGSRKDKTSKK